MGVIPEILYKYFPPERIGFEKGKGFFPNLEVSFTAPVEFNDPFDCVFYVKIPEKDYIAYLKSVQNFIDTKNKLQKYSLKKVKKSDVRRVINNEINTFRKRKDKDDYLSDIGLKVWEISTKSNVRILSLTRNYDNLLMWSHYAKNHTGFVVGIKSTYFESEAFKNVNRDIWGLKDVTYADKLTEFNPYENPMTNRSNSLPFFKKSKCWEYEEEVRFVGYVKEKCDNFKIEKIPNNFIESIRLGAKITEENKTKIIDFCNENLPEVSIYQARLQKAYYALDFIKI